MVLKCFVTLLWKLCFERVPECKLPQDEEEKKKWISVNPRANLVASKYTAVCGKRWPKNAEMVNVHFKLRPTNPSSVFPAIPSSCLKFTTFHRLTIF